MSLMRDMGRKPTVRPVKQLAIGFDAAQWSAVERFQRSRRLSSPTEAVRQLIWRGLESEGVFAPDTDGTDDAE